MKPTAMLGEPWVDDLPWPSPRRGRRSLKRLESSTAPFGGWVFFSDANPRFRFAAPWAVLRHALRAFTLHP